MTATGGEGRSVFDALLAVLGSSGDFNKDDIEAPAAILWPDEKREWEKLIPRFRAALPHLLIYGPYDAANRVGPAIWLRCAIAGTVVGLTFEPGVIPVLYLPGVSRSALRATDECPPELRPLAELQYRGVFWSQVNTKDWTVAAFLQAAKGGLGLALAKDAATTASLRRAMERLMDVPVSDLAGKAAIAPLDSGYFDTFVSDDPVDDLLSWLSDPAATQARMDAARWEALCGRCAAEYGFDAVKDGPLAGAEKLGLRTKPPWKTAWKRFTASPQRYGGLVELLRKAKPKKTSELFQSAAEESWPQDNEAEEAGLRKQLVGLEGQTPAAARKLVAVLETTHRKRREWVWARLGRSPLAVALQHLNTLAETTAKALGGATTDDMIAAYIEGGWKADAAMLESVAAVTRDEDRQAVYVALQHVYTPWLWDTAELFQDRVKAKPLAGREVDRLGSVAEGTCVLFADGLRFDVGQRLRAELEGRGMKLEFRHHTAAMPSVTPTAKPAISPVVGKIIGLTPGEDFNPVLASDQKDLTSERFRKLLAEAGYQVLAAGEVGDGQGRAWTECGLFDQTGHNEGIGLARRIAEITTGLVARVEALLVAGWQEVRIVTDHGWLLLPGGLPKTDLPKYLTATRWGRCAVVKPSATVELTCFHWFWAEDVRIACPPGIDCFAAGKEYNHGGVSLQECVVPQISVRGGGAAKAAAKIEQVKWVGLRCRVKVMGNVPGLFVDLRDKAADPATTLSGRKAVAKDGTAALVVENDQKEGGATNLVLLDGDGNVLEKQAVTVGG